MHIADATQSLLKRLNEMALKRRRGVAEVTYPGHLRALLCTSGKRADHGPRRRTAEKCDELAPPNHSITSSAVASRVDGTSRPSVRAVLRLSTSSYLVGACTGRSAGFSPLRMRST